MLGTRPLDHIVLGVQKLDAARQQFIELGFQVTDRMHHSTGTSNHLVMFNGNFIELLGGFGEVPAESAFDVVRAMGELVEKSEGVIATAFRSTNADRDFGLLTDVQVDMSPVASFTRPVAIPGRREGEVYCSVTMSSYPSAPRFNLFFSHQHRPEHVWIPEWQEHPNGAIRMCDASFVMSKPYEHVSIFEKMVGAAAIEKSYGFDIEVEREATLKLVSHEAWQSSLVEIGIDDFSTSDAYLASITIETLDIRNCGHCLKSTGIEFLEGCEGTLIVPADYASGLLIVFRER